MLLATLVQFVLQLAFGLALAMVAVPPRDVASGYFRNNLYVALGLSVLAAMTTSSAGGTGSDVAACIAAAVASYLGSALWLYERASAGRVMLAVIAATCAAALWLAPHGAPSVDSAPGWFAADSLSAGWLLGTTMAAMLLGHWYLNAPGMRLAPLKRLVALVAGAAVLRGAVCGAALAVTLAGGHAFEFRDWLLLALRWLAGIVGVLAVAGMVWQTLKIPNTQSATGILYVGVIGSFIGELTGRLLSAESPLGL